MQTKQFSYYHLRGGWVMQTKQFSYYHLSNISVLRPAKTMSIAMQNVTEFQKNQITMTKHSKKFSFTLEK